MLQTMAMEVTMLESIQINMEVDVRKQTNLTMQDEMKSINY